MWPVAIMSVVAASAFNRFFFFSSRRRHTTSLRDWSSDVCSSDLVQSRHPSDFFRQVLHLPRSGQEQPEEQAARSEERRVGKECRCGRSPDHNRKKLKDMLILSSSYRCAMAVNSYRAA